MLSLLELPQEITLLFRYSILIQEQSLSNAKSQNQSPTGDIFHLPKLPLLVRQLSITLTSLTKIHPREFLKEPNNLPTVKLCLMLSIHLRNGACLLVYTQMTKRILMPKCNFSLLRRDNNSSSKVMLVASLMYPSLITTSIRTVFSVSVKRKQMRLHKRFISWKSETQLQIHKSLREALKSKCHLMQLEISQFLCKLSKSLELSLL